MVVNKAVTVRVSVSMRACRGMRGQLLKVVVNKAVTVRVSVSMRACGGMSGQLL